MQTTVLVPFLLALATSLCSAEVWPYIEWQAGWTANTNDSTRTAVQTSDGGFLIGCQSLNGAFWTLRLNAAGTELWRQSYDPGTNSFLRGGVLQTFQGDFILAGYSSRANDYTVKTATNWGHYDFWLLKTASDGTKLWDKSFGGAAGDYLNALAPATNGYFLGGNSFSSPGGNKTSPYYGGDTNHGGGGDCWVVKADTNGDKIWEASAGGTLDDGCYALDATTDGGVVLAGWSESPAGGNKTSPSYGGGDFWVVRIDADGNKLWDRSYGGTAGDTARVIRQLPDGGFIVGGESYSGISGNKTSANFGNSDYWVLRLDANGNKVWESSYGGSGSEVLAGGISLTPDGGFIIAGTSPSPISGNKTTDRFGSGDFWIVRTDANGNKLWEALYGGAANDNAGTLSPTRDGGLLVGGNSYSGISGNKTIPMLGSGDIWIIKLLMERPSLGTLPQSAQEIHQNGFRMVLSGPTNRNSTIEYTSDLHVWTPLQTNLLQTSPIQVVDRTATNASGRFYRTHLNP